MFLCFFFSPSPSPLPAPVLSPSLSSSLLHLFSCLDFSVLAVSTLYSFNSQGSCPELSGVKCLHLFQGQSTTWAQRQGWRPHGGRASFFSRNRSALCWPSVGLPPYRCWLRIKNNLPGLLWREKNPSHLWVLGLSREFR